MDRIEVNREGAPPPALTPWAERKPLGPIRARVMPPTWHGNDGFRWSSVLLALLAVGLGAMAISVGSTKITEWVRVPGSFSNFGSAWPLFLMVTGTAGSVLVGKFALDSSKNGLTHFWKDARDTHRTNPIQYKEKGKRIAYLAMLLGIVIGGAVLMRSSWGDMDGGSKLFFPLALGGLALGGSIWNVRKFREIEDGDEDDADTIREHIDDLRKKDAIKLWDGDMLFAKPDLTDADPQLLRYYRASLKYLQEAVKGDKDDRGHATYRLAQVYHVYFHKVLSDSTGRAAQHGLEHWLKQDTVQQYIRHGLDQGTVSLALVAEHVI